MILLIAVSFLATRAMKLIPSGAQNFFESAIEFLFDQIEDIAGQRNARRFFPVIATLFIFILVSNWMGLLPFFNAIGKTEDIGHHIFHEIELHEEKHEAFVEDIAHSGGWLVDDTGIGVVKPHADDAHFTLGRHGRGAGRARRCPRPGTSFSSRRRSPTSTPGRFRRGGRPRRPRGDRAHAAGGRDSP